MMDILKKCTLCPRECKVNRFEEYGYCHASSKIKIARYSLHEWEEPCISKEKGSGTIFFSYCNMQCIFCQNYKISKEHIGYEITIDDFVNICLELQEKGAHNINLVTPTHYIPQIILGIKKARKKGLSLPIIYNSSGYEKKETIKLLKGTIDIYLPDFKYYDNNLAKKYSHAPNYQQYAIESLKEMYQQIGPPVYNDKGVLQKGVIVRHLCLPRETMDTKKILKYLHKTYANQIIISIMNQYTPVRKCQFQNLNRTLTEQEYEEIIDFAWEIGIRNAFIQEGETQKDSFIPEFFEEPKKNSTFSN